MLKPRYLPRIEPTSFNYPVDIYGKWHGNKYRFIQPFRSDHPDAITPNSMRRLRGWNTSAGIILTCLTIGTRVSGTVSINPFRSPRR